MKEKRTFQVALDALENLSYYCYDKESPKEIIDAIKLIEAELTELNK